MTVKAEPMLVFVRRRLDETKGKWMEVSVASGVPYHTLTKIAQGQSPNPRVETVQRLLDHFRQKETALAEPVEVKAA